MSRQAGSIVRGIQSRAGYPSNGPAAGGGYVLRARSKVKAAGNGRAGNGPGAKAPRPLVCLVVTVTAATVTAAAAGTSAATVTAAARPPATRGLPRRAARHLGAYPRQAARPGGRLPDVRGGQFQHGRGHVRGASHAIPRRRPSRGRGARRSRTNRSPDRASHRRTSSNFVRRRRTEPVRPHWEWPSA